MRGATIAAIPLLLATATLAAPESSGTLEPYRALARSREGVRLLAIARDAMESYWQDSAAAPAPEAPAPEWPGAPTAVYVSLVRGRQTRACVGSPSPLGTLDATVRALAREALVSDRRRPPVRREELAELRVVVTFAGEGEPVSDPMTVDPGREGLLVSGARGAVAFLPGEARTVAWALREARRIGVLAPAERTASYRRFPVVVLEEPPPRLTNPETSDALH